MKIAPISSTTPSMKSKWIKKNEISKELIKRVNKRQAETKQGEKLSALDKFAEFLLDKNAKKMPEELKEAEKQFNTLSKFDQDVILLSAKKRKDI